jgi:hypothetical protein
MKIKGINKSFYVVRLNGRKLSENNKKKYSGEKWESVKENEKVLRSMKYGILKR